MALHCNGCTVVGGGYKLQPWAHTVDQCSLDRFCGVVSRLVHVGWDYGEPSAMRLTTGPPECVGAVVWGPKHSKPEHPQSVNACVLMNQAGTC